MHENYIYFTLTAGQRGWRLLQNFYPSKQSNIENKQLSTTENKRYSLRYIQQGSAHVCFSVKSCLPSYEWDISAGGTWHTSTTGEVQCRVRPNIRVERVKSHTLFQKNKQQSYIVSRVSMVCECGNLFICVTVAWYKILFI